MALAMITNGASATQRAKIERFHLAPYFDHILIEGELGFGKPEPRGLPEGYGRPPLQPRRELVCGRQPGVGGRRSAEAGHIQRLGRSHRRRAAAGLPCQA